MASTVGESFPAREVWRRSQTEPLAVMTSRNVLSRRRRISFQGCVIVAVPTMLTAATTLCVLSIVRSEGTGSDGVLPVSALQDLGESPSVLLQGGLHTSYASCHSALVNASKECEANWIIPIIDKKGGFELMTLLVVVGSLAFSAGWTFLIWTLGKYQKPRMPKYWRNRKCTLASYFKDSYDEEFDVTPELKDTVQRLLDITTDSRKMGKGRDGAWATHRGLEVLKVTRIEHGRMWGRYKNLRRSMPTTQTLLNLIPEAARARAMNALSIIQRDRGRWTGDPVVSEWLKSLNLDASRNEQVLFHGCPGAGARDNHGNVKFTTEQASPLYAVKRQGFDDRLGSVKGMYGSGTYFADMASKADQYAGTYSRLGEGSVGEQAHMFLARVVLGCPYLTDQSLEQLRRPPCIDGHFDTNLATNEDVQLGRPWTQKGVDFQVCEHPRYDSVMQDYEVEGSRKLYREYIVYQKQCYPEFCVTYKRVERRECAGAAAQTERGSLGIQSAHRAVDGRAL